MIENNNDVGLDALEKMRMRLLDLTARNRLINFIHAKGSSLRIVDELPNQIVESLLNEKEMNFRAVPLPSKAELIDSGYLNKEDLLDESYSNPPALDWAKKLNINVEYELPLEPDDPQDEKYNDNYIQTLLYPHEMESLLKNLLQKSNSAMQEMGANILYLAVGFLVWKDQQGGKERLAPLFLVPVALNKGRLNKETKTYDYTLSYIGDELTANLSLKEKMRADFSLVLPELDENIKPEDYINSVKEFLEINKPEWSVKNYASLVLLNFSKLMMYLDLDPKRWPSGNNNLLDNSIIKKILTGVDDFSHVNQSLEHNDGEYLIDSIEDVHTNFPLIDDADSSQHSALIDALKGKSLVIEGPPGTGKSQTITNLIAAAISQGKKVLFVAEKQAALEVVYNRLNKVGLSDFCLELHSHKSQKNQVLKDVNKRIKKHKKYSEPKGIYSDIQYYEKNKNILNEYSEKVNREWKNTGKSPAEVFIASVMYTAKINFDPTKVSPDISSLDRFVESEIVADNDQVDTYSKIYKRVVENNDSGLNISDHPWFGVDNCEIHFNDLNSLEEVFRSWQNSLNLILSKFEEIKEFISTDNDISSFEEIYIISEDLARVPDLVGNEYLDSFKEIKDDNLVSLEQYLDDFLKIKDLYKSISLVLDDSIDASVDNLDQLITQRDCLLEIASETQSLDSLVSSLDKINLINSEVMNASKTLEKIKGSLKLNFNDGLTLGDLEKYNDIIQLASKIEPSHFSLRADLFDQEELDFILPEISNKITALEKSKKELSVYFDLNNDPSLDLVRVLKADLSNNGSFKVFNKSWRQAKSKLISLSNGNIKDFNILLSNIEPLELYLNEKDLFVNNDKFSRLLGPLFDGVNTDIDSIASVRSWYSDIRKRFGFGFSPNASIGRAIIDIDLDSYRAIRSLYESGFSQKLSNILDGFKYLKKNLPLCAELGSKNAVILGDNSLIDTLNESLSQALSALPSLNRINTPTISDLSVLLNNLKDLKIKVSDFNCSTVDADFFGGNLRLNYSEENTHNLSVLTNTLLFASCLSNEIKSASVANFISNNPEASVLSELKKLGFILSHLLEDHEQKYKVFQKKVNLNYEKWCFSFGQDLKALIAKNDKALSEVGSLSDWIAYVREREILVDRGYLNLIEMVESGALLDVKISDAYKAGFFDLLARQILKVEPDLAHLVIHKSASCCKINALPYELLVHRTERS